jgi:alpha-mannosidase
VGDHGGGPTRAILDEGEQWANSAAVPPPAMPKFQFGVAQSFFSSVEKQIAPESKTWDYSSIAKGYAAPPEVPGKVSIPTWKSELYFEYHRGVMTTQANHKRNMRESSEQVLNAEKWSSLAWLDGRPYPGTELTEDWKKVLFNQFHDLAAGSGIGVIYKEAQKDYDVVRWSTNEIKAGALETVAEKIDTRVKQEKSIPVVVFNPLGWERSGEVRVSVQLQDPKQQISVSNMCEPEGQMNQIDPRILSRNPQTGQVELTFFAPKVPALGYKLFRLGPPWRPKPGEPTPGCVHGVYAPKQESGNKFLVLQKTDDGLAVHVSTETGCITSIRDEKTKYEWLAPGACGNELQAFKDTPKEYDAWNIDPGTLDQPPTLLTKADSITMVGTPEYPAVRVVRSWQSSKFVQTISLNDRSDQVDIDNEIDWHETHVLLKVAFPLSVQSDHATYDIPYGTIERTTKRTNSWEKAQFEVPAQLWADLGDGQHGLSVINESKFGYDAAGNVLRLTLLRSPTLPDPDADRGHHHFRYALYPHAGTWQQAMTVRHGWEYNYPLTAVVTTAHPGELPASHSFISVSPDNVVLTAVKKAEDTNSLIFRVYEWAGKASTVEFHLPPGATGATVTNLQETPEGDALAVSGDAVKAPIKPFEILTVRVDYPEKR